MIKGINADLVPLDSCSQPVFKWSSLPLFHFPRSACVPEIMNCSNSNFNLGLEAWSFMTPWSSSNSLLLPTGLLLSHLVVQALLLLLLCPAPILVTFSFFPPPELLFCWQKAEPLSWEVRWARGQCKRSQEQQDCPFWHQQALRSSQTSHRIHRKVYFGKCWKLLPTAVLPPPAPGSSFLPVCQSWRPWYGPVWTESRNWRGLTKEFKKRSSFPAVVLLGFSLQDSTNSYSGVTAPGVLGVSAGWGTVTWGAFITTTLALLM